MSRGIGIVSPDLSLERFLSEPSIARLSGRRAQGDFIEVGQGVVDFKALARLFREIGFSGWVMLELERTRNPDIVTSARQVKTYVTGVLGLQFYPVRSA